MDFVYLDHAATTPVHPQAIEAMMPYLHTNFGNPSSIHAFGRSARSALDEARKNLAALIGARSQDLIFTSGGTEADNLALFGLAKASSKKGKHIITSQIEHHAVLHACSQLEEEGCEITYLPVDPNGRVKVEELKRAVKKETILVSIHYVNNEVGTIQPLEEIGYFLREKEIPFHTDAVQAFGLEKLDVTRLPVDLISLSSHKINGPKGVGALYIAPHISLSPLFFGGAQERKRRAGTENVASIVGFSAAASIACQQQEQERRRETSLHCRERLLEQLQKRGVQYEVNGDPIQVGPHILNLSFVGVPSELMLMNLDLAGYAVSSGSACTAGTLQTSHVLEAMHSDSARIGTAVRFSFGLGNHVEQMDRLAAEIEAIIKRVKR